MSEWAPGVRIVTGVLVLVVGFLFHWVGQLISLLNWKAATRLGLQEEGLLPEYAVYERAIAVSDVALGGPMAWPGWG